MAGTTCTYTLDADNPETWGGSADDRCFIDRDALTADGTWHCPHETVEGADLCPFHLPPEEKDDGAAVDALRDAEEGGDVTCFGARFGELDLSGGTLDAGRVELPHATVESCDWSGATIDVNYLNLDGLSVRGTADFRDAVVDAYTTFVGAAFDSGATFESTTFSTQADFRFARFAGRSSFRDASFGFGGVFASAEFTDDADFSGVQFGGDADFTRATFRKTADFSAAQFAGVAEFGSMNVYDSIDFEDATFDSEPDFSFSEIGDVDASGIK